MNFETAYALFDSGDAQKNAILAADKLKTDMTLFAPAAVLYFASPYRYDPQTLAAEMQRMFPGARTFGCSSSGELCLGRMLRDSVVAMAFSDAVFETIEVGVAGGVDADPNAIDTLLADLEARLGTSLRTLDFRRYLGFTLIDGLAMAVEKITETLGEKTDVIFTGGCAGDDGRFQKTVIFCDGKAHDNGALVAILKPRGKFGIIKTQSLTPTDIVLIATSVDDDRHVIREFNGIPAAQAYADAMGVPVDGMSSDNFAAYPLALMAGGEPFVRNAATVVDGGGIRLYTKPIEGMRYTVTKVTDLIRDTIKAVEDKRLELGGISAIINVNCLFRDLQARQTGKTAEFGAIFADFPCVGFSSYGEIYIGVVNQTSTMIAFA